MHGSMFNNFDDGSKNFTEIISQAFERAVDQSDTLDISLHDIPRDEAILFMTTLCRIIGRTFEETVYEHYSSFELVTHSTDNMQIACYTPIEEQN